MPKRLISINELSDAILVDQQNKGQSISPLVNAAIIDEFIPVYSSLEVEARYLLNCVAKEYASQTDGNLLTIRKSTVVDANRNIPQICKEALERGVMWLARHHIKNGDVLRATVDLFHQTPMNGGVPLDILNANVQSEMDIVQKKLCEIDPNFNNFDMGLGSLGTAILDHWDKLWDWNPAYDVIASVAYCEEPLQELDPFQVIQLLQWIESQFIIEAVGENTK